jgi:uncharacterized protein
MKVEEVWTEETTIEENLDNEVRSLDTVCINESEIRSPWWHDMKYMIPGIFFGILLVKSEVISWYRIQEMFRLQSFHMYGVIGSAVAVGACSVFLFKKFNVKTWQGEKIDFHPRPFSKGTIYGGLLFGFGWALTGACPGPLYAQIGPAGTIAIATLLAAIGGTWVYGLVREKLPH